jgi:uncharacterized protein (TIGR02246 family)
MHRAALAFALLAVACSAPQPPAPSADEVRAAIEAQNRAFGDAFRAGDAAAVAALYTDDGEVLPPNAPIAAGREALAQFWGGVLATGVAGAVLTTEEVTYAGGDSATEFGSAVLSAKDGSAADEAKYAVLWKQTAAGWRMHRDIWNSNRPAPEPIPPECVEACSRIRTPPAPSP